MIENAARNFHVFSLFFFSSAEKMWRKRFFLQKYTWEISTRWWMLNEVMISRDIFSSRKFLFVWFDAKNFSSPHHSIVDLWSWKHFFLMVWSFVMVRESRKNGNFVSTEFYEIKFLNRPWDTETWNILKKLCEFIFGAKRNETREISIFVCVIK